MRKACGRARDVVVVGYSGRGFAFWWEKNAPALSRCGNLSVIELPAGSAESLAALLARNMQLQCLVQEGELQLSSDAASVTVVPVVRQAAAAA